MPYKDVQKRREAVKKSHIKHSEKWKEYRKRYAQEHRELYRRAAAKYQANNREKLNAAARAYWHSLPAEQRKQKQLEANLGRFSLTPESYDAKLLEQGGVCAICKQPPKGKRFSIDHDHSCCNSKNKSCGKCIRGLLCSSCNLSLHAERGPQWYQQASDYLKRYEHP